MTDELEKYRRELYAERAEWAEFESDIEREMQLTWQGGFWHWLFSWFLRHARNGRLDVQMEIDDLDNDSSRGGVDAK